ncbi:hypothetical protein DSM25559_5068 [Agrobacterium rosae]|uniref:Transposase IS116/IS110/IS902 family protein n=1 Tax=Agrobacterium rosae TaxID=1972867 RepID=A0A1R3U2K0_9HYPH|nr:hypothetical protein DSM25559_5068 [Agrobacterium rosae]
MHAHRTTWRDASQPGKSKLEAIRCLKRYIAREVFAIIMRRHKEINQSQIAA